MNSTNTDYLGQKLVTNKRIIAYVMKQNKFWEAIRYGKKTYYRTFQNNVYERAVK